MISKSASHMVILSIVDIVVIDVLKYDADNSKNDNRDYFILCTKIWSKKQSGLCYYAMKVLCGNPWYMEFIYT